MENIQQNPDDLSPLDQMEYSQNNIAFENFMGKKNEMWLKEDCDFFNMRESTNINGGNSSLENDDQIDNTLLSPQQCYLSETYDNQQIMMIEDDNQNQGSKSQSQGKKLDDIQLGSLQNSQILPIRQKSNSLKIKKQNSTGQQKNSKVSSKCRFNIEDDKLILQKIQQHGKNWSTIAQYFPGKNESMIRNRYYGKLRQKQEKQQKSNQECSSFQESQIEQCKLTSDINSVSFNHVFEETQEPDFSNNCMQNDYNGYSGSNFLSPQLQYLSIQDNIDEFSLKNRNKGSNYNQLNHQEIDNNINNIKEDNQILSNIQEQGEFNLNNNEIAKMIQEEQNEYYEQKKKQDIFEEPILSLEQNLQRSAQKTNIDKQQFYFNNEQQCKSTQNDNIIDQSNFDEMSLVDEATEMPQYKQNIQKYQINQKLKMNKIEFLQNQVSHIEEMIMACKKEIIQEGQKSLVQQFNNINKDMLISCQNLNNNNNNNNNLFFDKNRFGLFQANQFKLM